MSSSIFSSKKARCSLGYFSLASARSARRLWTLAGSRVSRWNASRFASRVTGEDRLRVTGSANSSGYFDSRRIRGCSFMNHSVDNIQGLPGASDWKNSSNSSAASYVHLKLSTCAARSALGKSAISTAASFLVSTFTGRLRLASSSHRSGFISVLGRSLVCRRPYPYIIRNSYLAWPCVIAHTAS